MMFSIMIGCILLNTFCIAGSDEYVFTIHDTIPPNITSGGLNIVNGDPTNYKQWRGTLALRSSVGLCSAVAIDSYVLLSAAHCCEKIASDYEVIGGGNINIPESTIKYGGLIQHKRAPFGDLCMVHLMHPLPSNVPHYDILTEPVIWDEFTTITGYGYNTQGFPQDGLGIARMGTAKVEVTYEDWIDIGMTDQASCNGDSGGPMFVLRGSKMLIAGVTSAGMPGCIASGPAIYSSVATSRARTWITETFAVFMDGRQLTPGDCTSCNSSGDCDVCPGFPIKMNDLRKA